ncbi:MAG TPA: TauD/TfdA family dioxygenase [Alphaproteobacteria bacterium]|nr:TauD/TfdA family dioxygenase [Alphaproteobacteria bacterium]
MVSRAPISDASAWFGEDMARSDRWVRNLSAAALDEIDGALKAVRARGIPWHEIDRQNFPLPGLAEEFAEIARELEDGCGMIKLRGLPVERYALAELRQIWFGIGSHIGHPVYQNCRGELMRDIHDEGAAVGERYGQIKTGQDDKVFLSSYARTVSNGALRFHTDRCDVVGLLCVQQAKTGGQSLLCSSTMIHNEMLRRRPDLLDVLFQDFYRSRFGEEAGGPEQVYALPIFGMRNGKFTSHYSLTYIETAQMVPSVPRLTAAQREAIELLATLAKELAFEMTLEPGDIQLLNNHVIYHARTAFSDDATQGRRRLLLRLWLSMPNSRALPEGHEVLWGSIEPGAMRGGIGQAAASLA